MSLTRHAGARLQQRAIPSLVIELLERCGSTTRCEGADLLYFDKPARKRLERDLGGARSLRLLEPLLNVYAVINDNGSLVTAGHRSKRINRP